MEQRLSTSITMAGSRIDFALEVCTRGHIHTCDI